MNDDEPLDFVQYKRDGDRALMTLSYGALTMTAGK